METEKKQDRRLSKIKLLIIKLLTEGKTPKEIATQVGCSLAYVYIVMRSSGIGFRRQKANITEEQKAAIIRLNKEGYVDQKIADILGVLRETVLGIRVKNNLPTNGWVQPEKKKAIVDLCKNMTYAEVAEIVGEKVGTVYAINARSKKKTVNE